MAQINDSSGSYGAAGKIFLDIETVFDHLARLRNDLGVIPAPEDVRKFSGASHGVAAPYHAALRYAAELAARAAKDMNDRLVEADDAIRKAVEALTAHDADSKLAGNQLLGAIENSEQQDAASSTVEPAATTTSAAALTNAGFGI